MSILHYSLILLLTVLNITNPLYAIIIDDFQGGVEVSAQLGEVNFKLEKLSPVNQRLAAIGGNRKLQLENLSGVTLSQARLLISEGSLFHSQEANNSAISKILWDGSSSSNYENQHQLGGLNLTEDGSSKLLIKILNFDLPLNQQVNLEIKLYRGGINYLALIKPLAKEVTSSFNLEFPFKDFISSNSTENTPTNITAIELIIHGTDQAIDLQIDAIETDACGYLPQTNNRVVDRCGVCDGDGMSCLGCVSNNQTTILTELDQAARLQLEQIQKIATQIKKLSNDRKLIKSTNKLVKSATQLQEESWLLTWSLPTTITSCSNLTLCTSSNNDQGIVHYQTLAEELQLTTNKAIKNLKLSGASITRLKKMRKKRNELYSQAMKFANDITTSTDSCL